MLQFALCDRDFYANTKINNNLASLVMINKNKFFNSNGKTIAKFLILPNYRRNHIGKNSIKLVFEIYYGNWKFNQWKITILNIFFDKM